MSSDSNSEELPDWNGCIEMMYDVCADIAHPKNRKFAKIEQFYVMLQRMEAFLSQLKED